MEGSAKFDFKVIDNTEVIFSHSYSETPWGEPRDPRLLTSCWDCSTDPAPDVSGSVRHPELMSTEVQSCAHQQLVPIYLPKCLSSHDSLAGGEGGAPASFWFSSWPSSWENRKLSLCVNSLESSGCLRVSSIELQTPRIRVISEVTAPCYSVWVWEQSPAASGRV